MRKRRDAPYPVRLGVSLDRDTAAKIRALSCELNIAEAVIVRRAVMHGLSRAFEQLRREGPGTATP